MKCKTIIFLFVCFQLLSSCITIEKDIEIAGIVTWDYWKSNAGWKDYEAMDFYIDYNKLEILNKKLKAGNYSFIVFATAFCSECEEEIPKIFRVFREAGVKQDAITLVGLDKNNGEPSGIYKKYKVKTVPAVIILENNIEIGSLYGSFEDFIGNLSEIIERK